MEGTWWLRIAVLISFFIIGGLPSAPMFSLSFIIRLIALWRWVLSNLIAPVPEMLIPLSIIIVVVFPYSLISVPWLTKPWLSVFGKRILIIISIIFSYLVIVFVIFSPSVIFFIAIQVIRISLLWFTPALKLFIKVLKSLWKFIFKLINWFSIVNVVLRIVIALIIIFLCIIRAGRLRFNFLMRFRNLVYVLLLIKIELLNLRSHFVSEASMDLVILIVLINLKQIQFCNNFKFIIVFLNSIFVWSIFFKYLKVIRLLILFL